MFNRDPTLADEPDATGRFHPIDPLTELTRQLTTLLYTATNDHDLDR